MSAGSGPRLPGRRNNGLGAGTFFSVGDVDPRVGEHLLDVLHDNGIAAYLQPTVDHDAFTRAVSLPGQPTDRLWVDRSRLDEARRLLATEVDEAGHSPAPPTASSPADNDAAWEQIVATFDRSSTAKVPPWPVDEDAGTGEGDDADVAEEPPGAVEHEIDAGTDEEGYVPPPPPPLPRVTKPTAVALSIIGFGLAMLLAPRFIDISPRQGFLMGLVALIGGIGYLFWNLRDGPPDDDRPDHGAVV